MCKIEFTSRYFTWKKREWLERAIASYEWLQLYPHAIVSSGPFTCSVHCYITFNTEVRLNIKKHPPFWYQNNWHFYEEACKIITANWQQFNIYVQLGPKA